ncbi:MAG: hypothetical protein PHC88_13460 [Terrimicrobiaceae bacterium]|nr:hypothetical protein [Terrimicrobiaceae bacterium]
MRTTVTLDPDTERLLKEKVHRTRLSFKVVLNEAIRAGLVLRPRARAARSFTVKAQEMNLRPGNDPVRLSEFADDLELEGFRETTRRLSRKGRAGK